LLGVDSGERRVKGRVERGQKKKGRGKDTFAALGFRGRKRPRARGGRRTFFNGNKKKKGDRARLVFKKGGKRRTTKRGKVPEI